MNTVPCVLQLPEELEKAIGTMTRNEKALIYISRTYCSPASYSLNLNVPPEAEELEFEVELIQLIQVSELNQSSQVCEMAWTSDSGMIHNGWCLLLSMGQVRDMFGDGGLIKRRIRDGTGLPSLVLTHNVMSSTYTQSLETRMNIYWDWTEIAKGKEDNCRPVREFRWLCKTHVVFLQQILGLKKYHLVQVKLMTGVGLLVGQANFQLIALCKTVWWASTTRACCLREVKYSTTPGRTILEVNLLSLPLVRVRCVVMPFTLSFIWAFC